MFCPECGTLAFPDPSGVIDCTNYACGYKGSTSSSIKGEDGRTIDMTNLVSTSKAETREYEVIKDSDKFHGVLTVGDYMCPKCGEDHVGECHHEAVTTDARLLGFKSALKRNALISP